MDETKTQSHVQFIGHLRFAYWKKGKVAYVEDNDWTCVDVGLHPFTPVITTLYRKVSNDMTHLDAIREIYLAGIEYGKQTKIAEVKAVLQITDPRR